MKNLYSSICKATFALLFSFYPLFIFAQTWQWTNTAGRYHDDNGECTVIDSFGNIVVSGYFRDTIYFGSNTFISSGNGDMFVAKYSPDGKLLWANKGSSIGEDNAGSVTVDAQGNVYAGGWFNNTFTIGTNSYVSKGGNDIFLVKYNSTGTLQWVFTAGGAGSDKIMGLTTDSYGNCLVTGSFNNGFNFGTQTYTAYGSDQTFVARFSPSGNPQWFVQAGFYSTECWPSGIGRDRINNVYIAGSFRTNATFGNTTLSSGGANNNIYIAKIDTGGHYLWAKTPTGPLDDYSNGLITDDSGYIYVTGSFFDTLTFPSFQMASAGSKDGFVIQLDSAGNFRWAHNIGGVNSDKGIEIAIDKRRNSFVTGFYNGTAHFNTTTVNGYGNDDLFVAKYDRLGNIKWVKTAGGTGNDYGMGIGADFHGNISVTGSFQNLANFGGTNKTAIGGKDFYVSKLTLMPVVTTNPTAGFKCAGTNQTLKVKANGEPPLTYIWQRNGVTIPKSPNDTIITLNNLGSYDSAYYRCIVSNIYGSDTSAQTLLTVYPLPRVNLGIDTSFCQGGVAVLNAGTGFAKYTWSNGGSTQYQNMVNTSTLWVNVRDKNGCTSINDTININVYKRPIVNLGKDSSFCQGDSIRLDAGNGFTSYAWSDGHTGRYYNIKTSKTLSVIVQDTIHGCLSLPDTIQVSTDPLPLIKKLTDTSFCQGATVKLDVGNTSTYTFRWYYLPGNIYLSSFHQIQTDSSGDYLVEVSTTKGCKNSDTAHVIVYPLPIRPVINPSGTLDICDGDSILLSVSPGYKTYLWSDKINSPSRYENKSGQLWLFVIDNHGCISPKSDTVHIIVHSLPSKPIISFIGDTIVCMGDSITLGAPSGYNKYFWSNGDTTEHIAFSSVQSIAVYVTESHGCKSPVSDSVELSFYPVPTQPVINSCTSPSVIGLLSP